MNTWFLDSEFFIDLLYVIKYHDFIFKREVWTILNLIMLKDFWPVLLKASF